MSTLLKQVAEPQVQSKPRGKFYRYCTQCNKKKNSYAPLCLECKKNSIREPIDEVEYVISGIACRRIPLTHGQYATVSSCDYMWLMDYAYWAARWNEGMQSYYAVARVFIDAKWTTVQMHRVIKGTTSPAIHVDHRNKTTLCNVRENLRPCSRNQNMQNRKRHSNNTSGFVGVHWNIGHQKWHSRVSINGVRVSLGYFDDSIEAAKVRDAAAIEHYGEFMVLNFPIHLVPPSAPVEIPKDSDLWLHTLDQNGQSSIWPE